MCIIYSLISFYRTDESDDGEEIMQYMKTAPVSDILKREDYWGEDLSALLPDVEKWYQIIQKEGMDKAYDAILAAEG